MSRLFRRFCAPFVCLLLWAAPAAAQLPDPAPAWDRTQARALLAAIDAAAADGLDPAAYRPERIAAAIDAGDAARLATEATGAYRRLARDLIRGRVSPDRRPGWHIPAPEADLAAIDAGMAAALASGRVAASLAALAPRHPQYRALRAALAATPPGEAARAEAIRVNLERWRWLPRDLGSRHIAVNVPAFALDLVADGRVVARHRVIVGKAKTPTPAFQTRADGVILNPWWEVPASIVRESVGGLIRGRPAVARARGYVWTRGPDGALRVRQAPGPGNSLGQMKLAMANPFSIFIHDTPAKPLFEKPQRAFSHGCIRTDRPFDLAALLTGLERARIDAFVAAGETVRLEIEPLPVHIVYLTAVADGSGAVTLLPDIYGRDADVAAALAAQAE